MAFSNERRNNFKVSRLIIHFMLAVVALSCLAPFLLVISVSLTPETEIFKNGYSFIPPKITLVAYEVILENPQQLIDSYLVTAISTIIGTIGGLWLTVTVAYVMTRKDYKYRNCISFFIFVTMLFNGGIVPTYILISRWLNMKNTVFALFVPLMVSAYFVLLMKGFIQTIPFSLIESAKIDGAREIRIFTSIIIPISKPAFATIGLFLALRYWNDWYQCLMYIEKENLYTLQYLLMRVMKNLDFLNSEYAREILNLDQIEIPTFSARMAMCVLAAGPMVFVFPFFQKYFVQGLTMGSIKE